MGYVHEGSKSFLRIHFDLNSENMVVNIIVSIEIRNVPSSSRPKSTQNSVSIS